MTWLTASQAAERAQRDVSTITRDAQHQTLHGHQRTDRNGRPIPRSHWRFHPAAVDAWLQGADERAQRAACGCPNLRSVPARRAS